MFSIKIRRISRVFLLTIITAITILQSCKKEASEKNDDPTSAAEPEQENQKLQEQFQALKRDHIAAIYLLNDITRNLTQISGEEQEVRRTQSEIDPVMWETNSELGQQVYSNLNSIKTRLAEAEDKNEQLAAAVDANPSLAAYGDTIKNLRSLLDEKERDISILNMEVERLRAQVISDKKFMLGYYLVGYREEIVAALNRGDIRKVWRTYHISDSLDPDGVPQGFKSIGLDEQKLSLGHSLRAAKVLSIHKRHENLYRIDQEGDEWILRIQNPQAFWGVARYLIIEIQ